MSVRFNNHGLLCGYVSDEEFQPAAFTWTYDDFEQHLGESITPSMYRFMADYVKENITKGDLYEHFMAQYVKEKEEFQDENHCPGDIEEEAVNAYFDLPINRKIALHNQMLEDLQYERDEALAKEVAAIDALLDENNPFGEDSPISHEYADFLRRLIIENRKKADRLECEIHEEEQWRGGHEEGAENDV
jgi:hypothetical protein